MKYRILYVVMALLISNYSWADTWRFDKELKSDDFKFGEVVLTRIVDTRENQSYPEYFLRVKVNGEEEALYKNLTFSKAESFGNGKYILGVSNSGPSSFAYFIIDSSGNLLRTVNHSKHINYCEQSVTLRREWVNDKDLDIKEEYESMENEFEPKNPYVFLTSVTVKACNGKRVEIWSL